MPHRKEVGFGQSDLVMLEAMFPDADPAMLKTMRVMIPDGSATDDAGNPATEPIGALASDSGFLYSAAGTVFAVHQIMVDGFLIGRGQTTLEHPGRAA